MVDVKEVAVGVAAVGNTGDGGGGCRWTVKFVRNCNGPMFMRDPALISQLSSWAMALHNSSGLSASVPTNEFTRKWYLLN
eukprot:2640159-Prymnesium_polylepis.1